MDWDYLHLITHSFPIVLSVSGAVVGIAGWLAGRIELERWGLLALLIGSAFVIPAYVTGLVAADVAGERTFVRPSVVHEHRTVATFASIPLLLAGILAAFSFFDPGDARLRRFVLLAGLLAAGITGWAAWLGSRIEHGVEPPGRDAGPEPAAAVLPAPLATPAADAETCAPRSNEARGGWSPMTNRRRGASGRPDSDPGAGEGPTAGDRPPGASGGAGDDPRPHRDSGGSGGGPAAGLALLLLAFVTPVSAQQEGEESLERLARRIHAEAIVVDGHNDLPWRLRGERGLDLSGVDLSRRSSDGHTDIPRLREGGVDVQFWAAYVPARFVGARSTVVALEQIDLIRRLAARYPDALEMAYSTADIRRIVGEGKIASLVGIEGGHAISNSLPVLRQLYEAGARYMTLTHSQTLPWADAAGDTARSGGLSEFGEAVVREMNRLGMLVDISHVTAEAMEHVLEVTRAPVIFSHSSARALAEHPRNVPDEVLRKVAGNGGVVMVNFFPGFLVDEAARNVRDLFQVEERLRRENPDPEDFQAAMERWYRENLTAGGNVGTIADHIDHIVEVAGIDHVGLGSDFDGIPTVPEGMEDVSKFPALTEELLRRGYAEADVKKVLGGNLLRAFREVERAADRLRASEPPGHKALPYPGLAPERGGGDGD